jgi:small subunit ribosomal protein S7
MARRPSPSGIFYTALEQVEAKAGRPGIEVFEEALRRVMPVVEVKPRRVGGATYQVPTEGPPGAPHVAGIRWLVTYSRRRNGRTMVDRLANEMLDAANGTGGAVRKREEGFKMAEANKAFSHYRLLSAAASDHRRPGGETPAGRRRFFRSGAVIRLYAPPDRAGTDRRGRVAAGNRNR